MTKCIFHCPEGIEGRIDKILSDSFSEVSRTHIRRAIEEGRILRIDGSKVEPKTKIFSGEKFRINLDRSASSELVPYNYPLKVLFEDDSILVVHKDSGMVTHPGDGTGADTLVHALLFHLGENFCPVGSPDRPGIVHRLDKETSGVMVVAKTEQAHHHLVDQFSNRKTKKKYRCLVAGLKKDSGTFNGPIARHPKIRVKMAVVDHGKTALTTWRIVERLSYSFSLVECEIHTGRTHQIRVHFSDSGSPLAGDKTYGFKEKTYPEINFPRIMLHAHTLRIRHPESQKNISFEAPLPDDFEQIFLRLKS